MSDTFSLYEKYDHKNNLEKDQKPGYSLLYKMSFQELDDVKQYLDSHLAKKFI